jgi:hypothetical protein
MPRLRLPRPNALLKIRKIAFCEWPYRQVRFYSFGSGRRGFPLDRGAKLVMRSNMSYQVELFAPVNPLSCGIDLAIRLDGCNNRACCHFNFSGPLKFVQTKLDASSVLPAPLYFDFLG